MTRSGSGCIINIASGGGDVPAPTLSVYGMTKAGVMHLTGDIDGPPTPVGFAIADNATAVHGFAAGVCADVA